MSMHYKSSNHVLFLSPQLLPQLLLVFTQFFRDRDFGDDDEVSFGFEEFFVTKSFIRDTDILTDLQSFGDFDGDGTVRM